MTASCPANTVDADARTIHRVRALEALADFLGDANGGQTVGRNDADDVICVDVVPGPLERRLCGFGCKSMTPP
jgi:hypothetical protein